MAQDDPGPETRSDKATPEEGSKDEPRQASSERDDEGKDRKKQDEEGPPKPNPLKNPLVLLAIGAVVVLLIVGGLLWWLQARRWENTDDAYVDGHIVQLAPQVSGVVLKVFVTDNARVRAGQPLADIDPATFDARYQQAKAQADQATAQIGQQRSQIAAAEATYQQAMADERGAAAQAQEAADDLRRYQALHAAAPEAVSAQQLDQALEAARNTAAQRDADLKKARNAADQVRAAEAQVGVLVAQRAASEAAAGENHITLGYTRLYSPVDGHVAHLNVAPGNYVQPGQQLMAIVPINLWVTANFKETQLALMRVGQRVDVRIDACSSSPIRAHVDSIQRGAGQAFALLPPENATGNFVKVVQRVPVKIVFDRLPTNCPLGPGLSVEPNVLVRP